MPSRLALGVGLLAVVSCSLTYAALSGFTNFTPGRTGLLALFLINLSLGLTLAALIAWRLLRLWAERKSGRAGARLHVRLVTWFSAVAIVPAILVAVFASVTLNLGLDAMFSGQVQGALSNAVNVAQTYVKEHESGISTDIREIANSIESDPQLFDADHHVNAKLLFAKLGTLTQNRGLQASYIYDGNGHELGRSKQQFLKDPKPPSQADFTQARQSILIDTPDNGTVTALVQMQSLNDAYLEVVRVVDPRVFGYYLRTKAAVSEYNRLNQNRVEVQLVFAGLYVLVALVILLAAILSGLWAANRLVKPISGLISAAERVSEGDLTAQVKVDRDSDEIATLGLTFNRMTQQLGAQLLGHAVEGQAQ